MRRGLVAVLVLVLASVGCGGEPQAEKERPKAPPPEPVGLGETAEAGPFAVTLNGAALRSSGEGRYAVVDLTLENRGREPADASEVGYMLRDPEGYSFEAAEAPGQRPRPQGEVEPGDVSSGQVGFELGEEAADGELDLAVSLPDGPRAARFEFRAEVAEREKGAKPEPKPDAAQKTDGEPPTTAGYNRIEDPSGSLSVEVPRSWGSETGADSEGEGGENSWSYYAGGYLTASLTSARSLDAWYGATTGGGDGSGVYMVASEALAREYTDDELVASLLHEGKNTRCAAGPSRDLDRGSYSGKIRAWFDCSNLGSTQYTFAASPEGRPCAVVGGARVVEGAPEADREAVEHVVDSFEVDCGSLPPAGPLDPPSGGSSADPSASVTPAASSDASAEPQGSPCDDVHDRLNAGDDSLTSAELLACDLSPEAINPCEGNPDPSCAAGLPEGAYPSIGGPDGVGTDNECSDLPRGSPEAVACYEDLTGTASPDASASSSASSSASASP